MKTEVIQSGLAYLQRIGLWGDEPRPIHRYFLGLTAEVAFLFVPKIVFGPGEDGFEPFIGNLAELIFVSEVVISFALFIGQKRSFEKLVANLRNVVERFDSNPSANAIRTSIRNTEKFCKIYAIYIWISLLTFFGFSFISNLALLLTKSESERGNFMLMMIMKFYWLEIRRNINDYGIYFVLSTLACVASAYQSILKVTVVFTIIKYGAMMFEFTTLKIKHLTEVVEGDKRRQELREIIEIHQLALDYAANLEKSISYFLLNQMSCCVLMMCLMLYYLSTSFGANSINIILMFVVMMGEMGLYCFYGNTLSEKAAEVGHAMYTYPWYLEPLDIQKDMLFIIARSQRPTGITAAKFYFINRERFAISLNRALTSWFSIYYV